MRDLSDVKQVNPIDDDYMATLETYITVTREHIISVQMKVGALTSTNEIGGGGEMARAWNTLSEAAQFLNVAVNHVDYARAMVDNGLARKKNNGNTED